MTQWLLDAVPVAQQLISWALLMCGALFFISGSLGLLRFPDVYCRLHAVTKADTLGLGMVALAMAVRADNLRSALLLVAIWLLVLGASAVTCQLLARYSRSVDKVPDADREPELRG